LEQALSRFGGKIQFTSFDGSGLFTLPAFLRAYGRLRAFPFESVESPVDRDDVDLIAEARRAIDHPVSEHVRSAEYAIRLIRRQAVDIFNISITVAGGIQGMQKVFAIADAANIECLIGTTQELSIATAAQAHVGATCVRLDYASDPVGPSLYENDVTIEPVRFEGGNLVVPDGVGLGVEGDLRKIETIAAPLSAVNDVVTGYTRG
jgi:muconate cycloisomerase